MHFHTYIVPVPYHLSWLLKLCVQQEDTEKKLAARSAIGNVHTMFLASGVQMHGQHQNLMLTGNEIAAKLLQNRKQQIAMMATSSAGAMQPHFQQQQSATNVCIKW